MGRAIFDPGHSPSKPKVVFYTLGCKLNFAETSTLGRILAECGVAKAKGGEQPDLCVVNTCSVTEMADKKARSLIRRLHRLYPDAEIIVTGCYAQLKPDEIATLPGVAAVLGSNEKLRIAAHVAGWLRRRAARLQSTDTVEPCTVATTPFREIREFLPSCERGDRTRFWLKVQDGCDYFCTYCTIPFARGRSRSGLIPDLVRQAREAAAAGGHEIVLTGVNVGEFGRDNNQSFLSLLQSLDKVEGISRYRISSIEPNLLTPEIIRWIAEESRAFMPSFHIPLQAGSDVVLHMMNRRYDTALFASRIKLIRRLIPDAFIGVDIMAGARGETPEEWERGLDFVRNLDITRLHVFPYSERPGTRAVEMGGYVEPGERHRRVGVLTDLSAAKLGGFMHRMEGTVRPVLWEHTIKGATAPDGTLLLSGLTDNYLRVVAPGDESLCNKITPVRLGVPHPTREETMTGVICGGPGFCK